MCMASAVLASNNEPHWGPKVYHRDCAVNNAVNRAQFAPISNPNPSPNVQSRRIENPSPLPPAADVISRNDYITINLSEYSRAELRGLKWRLRAELDQVGQVRARVETLNVISRPQFPKKGQKRAITPPPNHELKRLAAANSPELDGILKKMMMRCSQMLGKLMKHKHAWIFNTPVDTVGLGLRDYFQIIDQPMDLGTVKTKLRTKEYINPIEFASDVRLTFKNAMRYNPKGQDAHIMAETLLGVFEKMFSPAIEKFEDEKGRVLASLGMKIHDVFEDTKPVVDKSLPKPKALQDHQPKMSKTKTNDASRREMSFEEKEKLGIFLQELPSDKMGAMLEILSKRNTGMAQEGDEIELDFEALDNDTLWELDRFVNDLKKVENKINTQAPAQIDKSPIPEVSPQKSTKVDIMEDDVDIGDDIPINNYPPVEIEKDTNCSSSSSSGGSSSDSSSSGSGSVSSSGSDSEEDSVQSPFVQWQPK